MKKSHSADQAPLMRSCKLAHHLIERMLKQMQVALRDPTHMDSPEWEYIFGKKQTVAANLHKLVQTLASLPMPSATLPSSASITTPRTADSQDQLSAEEMHLLAEWIKEGKENRMHPSP